MHLGSLIAALGSYLEAKRAKGKWLLRMEDIDPPREVPGAADLILKTLETLGFEWDEPVVYQSARREAYEATLQRLRDLNLAYVCSCSRSEVLQAQTSPVETGEEPRYPGFCRAGPRRAEGPFAFRFLAPSAPVRFRDELHGEFTVDLADTIGDFVIKRRDGLFAYQLAVVVDDEAQGITDVVRGADLLFNTPRQLALQRPLRFHHPRYVHLPLLVDADGRKLSKSTRAAALDLDHAAETLCRALALLGQAPPAGLARAQPSEVWDWAAAHWSLRPVGSVRQLTVT